MFHKIGDACECGVSPEEMEAIIIKELEEKRDVTTIKDDLREMKELVGFLGMRIRSLEQQQDHNNGTAKIISINKE